MSNTAKLAYWGCFEGLGHIVRYGKIREVTEHGVLAYEVTTPDSYHSREFVEVFSAASMFRITRASEKDVMRKLDERGAFILVDTPFWEVYRKQKEDLERVLYEDEVPF